MEVKPGIDRVRCPACGMTYLIERDRASHPGIPADASGDNPVDVMLVPFPHNTISLGKNTLKNIPVLKDLSMDQHLLPRDSSWTGLSKDLDVHLAFLARLVYATGETYTLDIGNFALDPVMMYYQGSDRHIAAFFDFQLVQCKGRSVFHPGIAGDCCHSDKVDIGSVGKQEHGEAVVKRLDHVCVKQHFFLLLLHGLGCGGEQQQAGEQRTY